MAAYSGAKAVAAMGGSDAAPAPATPPAARTPEQEATYSGAKKIDVLGASWSRSFRSSSPEDENEKRIGIEADQKPGFLPGFLQRIFGRNRGG
jgi:hypothetical protein